MRRFKLFHSHSIAKLAHDLAYKTTQRPQAGKGYKLKSYTIIMRLQFCIVILGLLWLAIVCLGRGTKNIVRHTESTNPQADGFWANKTSWNARWVKYWRTETIHVPLWKKVWTPTIHNEWVPLPNAPEHWQQELEHTQHTHIDRD